jgi:hypothetical protein
VLLKRRGGGEEGNRKKKKKSSSEQQPRDIRGIRIKQSIWQAASIDPNHTTRYTSDEYQPFMPLDLDKEAEAEAKRQKAEDVRALKQLERVLERVSSQRSPQPSLRIKCGQ